MSGLNLQPGKTLESPCRHPQSLPASLSVPSSHSFERKRLSSPCFCWGGSREDRKTPLPHRPHSRGASGSVFPQTFLSFSTLYDRFLVLSEPAYLLLISLEEDINAFLEFRVLSPQYLFYHCWFVINSGVTASIARLVCSSI